MNHDDGFRFFNGEVTAVHKQFRLDEIRSKLLLKLFLFWHDDIRKTGIKDLYNEYSQSQYYSSKKLQEIQNYKLGALIKEVAHNVPYYNIIMNHLGVDFVHFNLEDLPSLPILTKDILRQNLDELKNRKLPPARFMKNSTSGSSGSATYFFSDTDEIRHKIALNIRQNEWMGVDQFSKQLWIWGRSFTDTPSRLSSIKDRIKGKWLVSSYNLSDQDICRIVQTINKIKPNLIGAYPSHLALIAERGEALKHWPQAISLSGETLYNHQREVIEGYFKAPVFNYYGARDGSMIAMECSAHNGLHVFSEHLIVEVVDDDGLPITEGIGKILITQLSNFAMPLIRYDIGDYAEVSAAFSSECNCGRTLPRLGRIVGRTFEIVTFPNGNRVGGTFWTFLMKSVGGIRQFHVFQNSNGKIIIRYTCDHGTRVDVDGLVSNMIDYGGKETVVEFVQVSTLDVKNANGKLKFVESEFVI